MDDHSNVNQRSIIHLYSPDTMKKVVSIMIEKGNQTPR